MMIRRWLAAAVALCFTICWIWWEMRRYACAAFLIALLVACQSDELMRVLVDATTPP